MSTQRLCLTFVWLFFADGTSHDMVRNTTHLSYCSHIRIRRPTAVSSGKQRRDEIVHRTDISTQYGQKERTINKCSMTHTYHCLQPSATICCNHLEPSAATICNHLLQPSATIFNSARTCTSVRTCTICCNHLQPSAATICNHLQLCTHLHLCT